MNLLEIDILLASVLLLQQDTVWCETSVHYGPETLLKKNHWTDIKCPCDLVGIKCECEPWPSCNGAFFHPDGNCRAYCSGKAERVRPKVTCEPISSMVEYKTVMAPTTGTSLKPVATCPEGSELVGCSIHSEKLHKFPGIIESVSGNNCTTSMNCGSKDNNGCTSYATCKKVADEQEKCEEGSYQMVEESPEKYLYCDENGIWHEMQCPCKEIFFLETNTCGPEECRSIFENKLELPPIETVENPCTAEAIDAGHTSHAYHPNHNNYIECESEGIAIIKSCPSMMMWNADTRNCTAAELCHVGTNDAPCTLENILEGKFLHHVPGDNKSYILCDLKGNSKVLSCPEGMKWLRRRRNCIPSDVRET